MDKVSTDDNSWISILNAMFRFYAGSNIAPVMYPSKYASFYQFYFIITLKLYHSETTLLIFYHDCNVKCVQYTDCVATKLLPVYTSNKTIAPIGWIWLVFQTLRRRFMCPNTSFFFVINNCLLQKHGVLTM